MYKRLCLLVFVVASVYWASYVSGQQCKNSTCGEYTFWYTFDDVNGKTCWEFSGQRARKSAAFFTPDQFPANYGVHDRKTETCQRQLCRGGCNNCHQGIVHQDGKNYESSNCVNPGDLGGTFPVQDCSPSPPY